MPTNERYAVVGIRVSGLERAARRPHECHVASRSSRCNHLCKVTLGQGYESVCLHMHITRYEILAYLRGRCRTHERTSIRCRCLCNVGVEQGCDIAWPWAGALHVGGRSGRGGSRGLLSLAVVFVSCCFVYHVRLSLAASTLMRCWLHILLLGRLLLLGG
mgnify:CR=1 FL=1